MQATSLGFSLQAWSAWTPEQHDAALTTPAPLRRRLSPLSQQALNAAWSIMPEGSARIVFSSRHGEFSRTLSLFKALATKDGVSPADFTLSVHHVLTGLLSIAQGNRQGHIAVAGGEESFCYGFLEALACLHENPHQPVLLIHCDEPLPAPYDAFNDQQTPIALALLLTAPKASEFTFSVKPNPAEAGQIACPASEFLHFLTNDHPELTCTGERMQWQWARHAAA